MSKIPADLADLAKRYGYAIEYRPLTYVKRWPTKSTRPWLLHIANGGYLASFATLDRLERNLRARAGL